MEILQTILYILLFLVFLSTLIMVHELGHLAAAKAFRVYCLEYSIGMGPLLFKRKRKNGETQFSLRAIPFGGYVSMYGEGVELPEGVEVPPERSLNNIKWWKRAIILVAGVTMNAVLAITFFFISNCIPQTTYDYVNQVSVEESSAAYNAGLTNEGYIKFEHWYFYDSVPIPPSQRSFFIADIATTFNGDDSVKYALCYNFDSLSLKNNTDFASFTCFYEIRNADDLGDIYLVTCYNDADFRASFKILVRNGGSEKENGYVPEIKVDSQDSSWIIDGFDSNIVNPYIKDSSIKYKFEKVDKGALVPDFTKYVAPSFDSANIHLTKRVPDAEGKLIDGEVATLNIQQHKGAIIPYGLSLYTYTVRRNPGQAFAKSFRDFGESSVLLVKSLGELFTKPSTWKETGGIISVAVVTTGVLQESGFARFLYVWAFISVNLAVFNLLPFPGLDGWQLLVTFVEAATRKKIPDKAKNIVSLIGLGLLLLLMGALVILDLGRYVFGWW